MKKLVSIMVSLALLVSCISGIGMVLASETVTPYFSFSFDANGNWVKENVTVRTILDGTEAGSAAGNITKGTLIGDGLGYGYNVAKAGDGMYFGGTFMNAVPEGEAALFVIDYYLNGSTSSDVMVTLEDNQATGAVEYKALAQQSGTIFYVLTAENVATVKGNKWGGDMRLRLYMNTANDLYITGAKLINLDDYCTSAFATEAGKADLHVKMAEKNVNVTVADNTTCNTCGAVIAGDEEDGEDLPAEIIPYFSFGFKANGDWDKDNVTVRTILDGADATNASGNITKGTLIGDGLGYGYNVAKAGDGMYLAGTFMNAVPEGEAAVFVIDYYLNGSTSDDVMITMADSNGSGTVEYKALAQQSGTIFYVLTAENVAAVKGNKWGGDMRLRLFMNTANDLYITGAKLINLDDYCTSAFATEAGKADLHVKMVEKNVNVTTVDDTTTCNTCGEKIVLGDGPVKITPYWEFNFDASGNWFKTGGTVRTILNGEEAKDASGNITKGTLIGEGLGYGYNVATVDDGMYFGGTLMENVPEGQAVAFVIDYYLNGETSDDVMLTMTDVDSGLVQYKALKSKENGQVFFVLSADAVAAIKGNKWGGDMRLRLRMKVTETLFIKGAKLINLADYCGSTLETADGQADLHAKMLDAWINVTAPDYVTPTYNQEGQTGVVTCTTCGEVLCENRELPALGYVVPDAYVEFYFNADGSIFKSAGVVRYITGTEETNTNITAGQLINDEIGYGYAVTAANDGLYFGGRLFETVPDGQNVVFMIDYYLVGTEASAEATFEITDNESGIKNYTSLSMGKTDSVFYIIDDVAAHKNNQWGGDMRLRIRIQTTDTLYITAVRLIPVQDKTELNDLIDKTAEITQYKTPASVLLYMEEVAKAQAVAEHPLASEEQVADTLAALKAAAELLVDCAHENGTELVDYKEETCLLPGYSGDLRCVLCGYIAPENKGEEIPPHATEYINVKETSCGEAGYTGDLWCTVCETVVRVGDEIPSIPHTFDDGVITKPATPDERGEITVTCTVCGDTYVTYFDYEFTGVIGDVDGNEAIDSTDARMVLQYAVGKIDETAILIDFADVDGSGKVDSTDARLILQYAVGKIQAFQ